MNDLQLVKSKPFGTIECNFYENPSKEIFMTREQIGTALGYAEPRTAIRKIHDRNADRLDKFSGGVRLVFPSGGTQETIVYTAKGVYEICRFSRQPKADEFVDFVWDTIEAIRKGYIGEINLASTPTTSPGGVANLVNTFRRIMCDQGSSPAEISLMARNIGLAYGIPLPDNFVKALPGQIPGQLTFLPNNTEQ